MFIPKSAHIAQKNAEQSSNQITETHILFKIYLCRSQFTNKFMSFFCKCVCVFGNDSELGFVPLFNLILSSKKKNQPDENSTGYKN